MTRTPRAIVLSALLLTLVGCGATPAVGNREPWPGELGRLDADSGTRQVTVVIALSSIVPAGIIGHAGVAVDEQYWDFGPDRVEHFQRLKGLHSMAGPWWDDPEQGWATDRPLTQVLADAEARVHPPGSLVALMRVEVTDEQAQRLIAFWEGVYGRMRARESVYTLAGRQCSSMVGWGLDAALNRAAGSTNGMLASGAMPADLRLMTPTKLYESLRRELRHTAGPRAGQPADLTVWQVGADGLAPYERPAVWDALRIREMPRTRLGIERVKYLPVALTEALSSG